MNGYSLGDVLQKFEDGNLNEAEFVGSIDEFMEIAYSEIDGIASSNPMLAYTRLNQTMSMLSFISLKPGFQNIKNRLNSWLPKLQQLVSKIARNANAETYSVTIEIPWGVSVTVQWRV